MSSPRRIVKIRMTQRVAEDSPNIIRSVADVFQNDDLEISIDESMVERVEAPLPGDTLENARATLDLKDQAVKQGMETVDSPEKSGRKVRQWLKSLGEEGIKITAQVIIKELISSWVKHP